MRSTWNKWNVWAKCSESEVCGICYTDSDGHKPTQLNLWAFWISTRLLKTHNNLIVLCRMMAVSDSGRYYCLGGKERLGVLEDKAKFTATPNF